MDDVKESEDAHRLGPDQLVKHPLQNRWTLWFMRNTKTKNWEDNLCEVTSFETVEDFWALYNHIESASKLSPGCDYSLFKAGIKPMWEDDRNKRGGRWLINLNKSQRMHELDSYWLETVLCLIGEAFDGQSDDICGAVVNVRGKGDKICVWTSDARNDDNNRKIGWKLKERLSIQQKGSIFYQAHDDSQTKTSSTARSRMTV